LVEGSDGSLRQIVDGQGLDHSAIVSTLYPSSVKLSSEEERAPSKEGARFL